MQRIEVLENLTRPFYNGDPSHDFSHIQRVMGNARLLQESAGGNLEFILAGALLHDVINLPKNHPDRARGSELASLKARELLAAADFSSEEADFVARIIVEHSFSRGLQPSSLEAAILQDADRLDSLGAFGILRTVTCGAFMGCAYYDPADPFAVDRELNDQKFTVDHFYKKLFRLPDLMNTSCARTLAFSRMLFMQEFLEQLRTEILC